MPYPPPQQPLLFAPTLIDGYKFDHRRQYGTDVTKVYSNMTARGSRVPWATGTVFFGAQYFYRRYLGEVWGEFFDMTAPKAIARFLRRTDSYLPGNGIGSDHMYRLHDLGYMPLKFCSVPEGTFVPLRVPMLTIENTHPDFAWCTNYIETILSTTLWGPITSATTAFYFRNLLELWALKTGTPAAFVDWQGHDFSMRGMFGLEAAMMSGAAHLTAFKGTDSVPALDFLERYYDADEKTLLGASVPATEHSVMCAHGKENEQATFEYLLDLYPMGFVSVVSDTWDLLNVVRNILPALKNKILGRDGKLVIRPDSGDPVKIICGDADAPEGSLEYKGLIECLWDIFGGTRTPEGYKMLDSHIGAIYGDSINQVRAGEIVSNLEAEGFASGNIVLGIGSFTYQYVSRDTYNNAIKATWIEKNGQPVDIYKAPKTDTGMKFSARGRLAALRNAHGILTLVEGATAEEEARSLLQPSWKDGKEVRTTTIELVRANVRDALARAGV